MRLRILPNTQFGKLGIMIYPVPDLQLIHFHSSTEVDKFLLLYVILKLKLVKGKCIIFVNDVERCYRVKLFLEQFSIKSCVLNSELPLNSRYGSQLSPCIYRLLTWLSRYHVVQEFNKGVYDYIIASDESVGKTEQDEEEEEEEVADGEDECMFSSYLLKLRYSSPFF